MKKNICWLLLFCVQSAFSQKENKTICVKDAESKVAIPYAIIHWENGKKGNYCDSNGVLTINSNITKNQNIVASCLGFTPDSTPVISQNQDTIYFYLESKKIILPEFLVEVDAAVHILSKAIRLIPENYIKDAHALTGYYKQTHTENNITVRLIESVIKALETGTLNKQQFSHRFKILALRRSNNYEENKEEHGDHLYDLFAENYIVHPNKSILNIRTLYNFDLSIQGSSESKIKIYYQEKNIGQEYIKIGTIVINSSDFAILEIKEKEIQNPEKATKREFSNGKYLWVKVTKQKTITFKKNEWGYFTDSISMSYVHQLKNTNTSQTDFVLNEQFIFKTRNCIDNNEELETYSKSGNLYLAHYRLDDWKLWENSYRNIFPLNHSEIKHLIKYSTLEEQFYINQ